MARIRHQAYVLINILVLISVVMVAGNINLPRAFPYYGATRSIPTPRFESPNRLLADDGKFGDHLGSAIAASGDRIVIGAPGARILHGETGFAEQGAVYVFVRNGDMWAQEAKLIADEGIPEESFGHSVAISGNTIVVGTRFLSNPRTDVPGAAYVFTRENSTWVEQARLTDSDPEMDEFFGTAVAISGDTLAVGTDGDDVGQNIDQGSVHIFTRNQNTWTERAKLTASVPAARAGFGNSVALSGATLLVGASRSDIPPNSHQGTAYIFTGSDANWSQQAKLVAADGLRDDEFGAAVALDGQTAIISNETDDLPANSNQGSAYIFVRSGTSWTRQAKLKSLDVRATKWSPYSVAVSGDTVLLGTYEIVPNGPNVSHSGSVSVFVRNGTSWSQQAQLTAGGHSEQSAGFGSAVAMSGNIAFSGAAQDSNGQQSFQGAAYAFTRTSASRWQQVQKVVINGDEHKHRCGGTAAISGDTAVFGCRADDDPNTTDQGSAYVFVRNGMGWAQQAKLAPNDGGSLDEFGNAVAISGNTIVVGAAHKSFGLEHLMQGAAYVFTRSGTQWTQQARLLAGDGGSYDVFGYSVAIEGDRIAIGAMTAQQNIGAAYLFTRRASAWRQTRKLIAADGVRGDNFGSAIAISGTNVAVGAQGDFSGPLNNKGSVYVFAGGGSGSALTTKVRGADVAAHDGFGSRIAMDGSVLIVGSMQETIGTNQAQGSAYIFTLTGSRWIQRQKLFDSHKHVTTGEYFGSSVSISGNTIAVGAGDSASAGLGSVFVFRRNITGIWLEEAKFSANDPSPEDRFATSVAISGQTIVAGNVPGDFGQDLIQGATYFFVRRVGVGWTP